ncbi:hypothetical protein FI667_g1214, partial [Globisporangium splendens]
MVMLAVLRTSARRASTSHHLRLRISSSAALVQQLAYVPPSSVGLRVAGASPEGALSTIFRGAQPHRFLSTAASNNEEETGNEDSAVKPEESELVYEGPMARAVRLMKGVSVTSCILTSVGMPTLCLISEQSTSMVGKLFGLGTTSLFHVLFKPYVMRMWRSNNNSDDPELTVETVTLFAQLTKHSFKLSDVAPPPSSMHPMLSFQAKGKNLFVHPEEFEDRELAEKLIGKKLKPCGEEQDEEQ